MITFIQIGNYGRFANQLFQYAMLFGVAKKNGYDFSIPQNSGCSLGEVFDGIRFTVSQDFSSINQTIVEPNGAATVYLPQIFELPDGVNYAGYFQSPKYFQQFEVELKQHLLIKQQMLEKARAFVQKHEHLGFIHVRRGDYVTIKNGTCHPPVTVDYIRAAIEKSAAKKFVILSDDMEWCRQNLDFVDAVPSPFVGQHFGYDFALMTECKSAIISNSSFSWWGAWLGEKKDVIAPSVWFGTDPTVPQQWNDIYCEGWNVI
jgi:hypothetical protein